MGRGRGLIAPLLGLLLGLTGCDYNRFDPVEPNPYANLTANTTPGDLYRLAAAGTFTAGAEMLLSGVVTSSDSAGNFYRTLVVQQDERAVELLLGTYDIYSAYPRGQQVIVRLDGLGWALRDGLLQVGWPADGTSSPDYIGSSPLVRGCVVRAGRFSTLTPPRLRLDQITADRIGQLVTLTGGSFTQGGSAPWSGERTYSAPGTTSIRTYTSPYASFAGQTLPAGAVDLTGIVTSYQGRLQLKISSTDDVRPTP